MVSFIDFPLKFKPISGKAKRLSGRSGGLRGDLEAHAGSGEAGAKAVCHGSWLCTHKNIHVFMVMTNIAMV